MRSMTKKAVLPAAATLMVGALLAGCSGGDGHSDGKSGSPSASPTATTAPVDDAALTKAMDKLVYHGTDAKGPDGGSCVAQAVRNGGVSEKGMAHIVAADGDDLGALADGMWNELPADAAILASPELRGDLDNCKDAGKSDDEKPDGKTYESPRPAQRPDAGKKPDLKPKFDVSPDAKITSSSQLTDGLVSMFSSFAANEKQEKTYGAAGECLSGVVWDAGFSQEALHFLAGGAPIGTGSVAEHLPNQDDRAKWKAKEFSTALMDCTLNVDPADVKSAGK